MALEQAPPVLHTVDVVSSGAIFFTWASAFFGLVPVFAAVIVSVAGAVYYFLAIFNHPAVRAWFRDRRERRIIRYKTKLLKLQLDMVRHANGDIEFWQRTADESAKILAELKAHQRKHDGDYIKPSVRGSMEN
jgi:hypothetical protein